ncbi:unnamed protein product, partial [Mesorhabditis belari]|uniref:SPOC domain-containing protein n=1 Tax=Mesorhabditis belari TaxID=2138241 RepID=A0AAF3FLG0_9BILA
MAHFNNIASEHSPSTSKDCVYKIRKDVWPSSNEILLKIDTEIFAGIEIKRIDEFLKPSKTKKVIMEKTPVRTSNRKIDKKQELQIDMPSTSRSKTESKLKDEKASRKEDRHEAKHGVDEAMKNKNELTAKEKEEARIRAEEDALIKKHEKGIAEELKKEEQEKKERLFVAQIDEFNWEYFDATNLTDEYVRDAFGLKVAHRAHLDESPEQLDTREKSTIKHRKLPPEDRFCSICKQSLEETEDKRFSVPRSQYCSEKCVQVIVERAHQKLGSNSSMVMVLVNGSIIPGPTLSQLEQFLLLSPQATPVLPAYDSANKKEDPAFHHKMRTEIAAEELKNKVEKEHSLLKISYSKTISDGLMARVQKPLDYQTTRKDIKELGEEIVNAMLKRFGSLSDPTGKSWTREFLKSLNNRQNKGFFVRIVKKMITPDKLVSLEPSDFESSKYADELVKVKVDSKSESSPIQTTPPKKKMIGDGEEGPRKDTTNEHGKHLFDLNCKKCCAAEKLKEKERAEAAQRNTPTVIKKLNKPLEDPDIYWKGTVAFQKVEAKMVLRPLNREHECSRGVAARLPERLLCIGNYPLEEFHFKIKNFSRELSPKVHLVYQAEMDESSGYNEVFTTMGEMIEEEWVSVVPLTKVFESSLNLCFLFALGIRDAGPEFGDPSWSIPFPRHRPNLFLVITSTENLSPDVLEALQSSKIMQNSKDENLTSSASPQKYSSPLQASPSKEFIERRISKFEVQIPRSQPKQTTPMKGQGTSASKFISERAKFNKVNQAKPKLFPMETSPRKHPWDQYAKEESNQTPISPPCPPMYQQPDFNKKQTNKVSGKRSIFEQATGSSTLANKRGQLVQPRIDLSQVPRGNWLVKQLRKAENPGYVVNLIKKFIVDSQISDRNQLKVIYKAASLEIKYLECIGIASDNLSGSPCKRIRNVIEGFAFQGSSSPFSLESPIFDEEFTYLNEPGCSKENPFPEPSALPRRDFHPPSKIPRISQEVEDGEVQSDDDPHEISPEHQEMFVPPRSTMEMMFDLGTSRLHTSKHPEEIRQMKRLKEKERKKRKKAEKRLAKEMESSNENLASEIERDSTPSSSKQQDQSLTSTNNNSASERPNFDPWNQWITHGVLPPKEEILTDLHKIVDEIIEPLMQRPGSSQEAGPSRGPPPNPLDDPYFSPYTRAPRPEYLGPSRNARPGVEHSGSMRPRGPPMPYPGPPGHQRPPIPSSPYPNPLDDPYFLPRSRGPPMARGGRPPMMPPRGGRPPPMPPPQRPGPSFFF